MPVIIPKDLPASKVLQKEFVFVMHEQRAKSQDIRPLELAIVNLMPKKVVTETQLLRLIGNSPLQVNIDLVQMGSHKSKNTSQEHLLKFYKTFEEIKNNRYDGIIVTGAPVEHLQFEEVNYWEELCEVFEFIRTNVFSALFICWGAQAAFYHYYGIKKHLLDKKLFGIFEHKIVRKRDLVRGFDDVFCVPQSRHTQSSTDDIAAVDDLKIVAESKEAGVGIAVTRDQRWNFVTGHLEYDPETLKEEYERDLAAGLPIELPKNYFPDDNPKNAPVVRWRSHGTLLFSNWLNRVYQETPYDLKKLKKR